MSLRSRLLLAVGAVALIALLAADVATYSSLRAFLHERVDQSLDSSHQAVEEALDGRGPRGQTTVAAVSPGTYVEVRAIDGSVLDATTSRRQGEPEATPRLPERIDIGGPGPDGEEPAVYLTVDSVQPDGTEFRIRAAPLDQGRQLIVAVPLDDTAATLRRLLRVQVAVTAAALLAAVGLGYWLVRVGLRPLADVEQTANAIAGGQLDRRIPGDQAKTEVGRLSLALNTMLKRIEEAFAQRDATEADLRRSEERLRRFVADASHELRTPLAAVTAYAELFDRGASERPEDLPRVIAGIRTESSRMGELVEELLLLARLDEGRPLDREPVELVSVAAEAVAAAATLGPEWPVTLEADRPVEVVGDAARLRQVFDNLLANVRAHTQPGTPARVRLTEEAGTVTVEVADSGPGLTGEEAARAFERFYRADPSRSRQRGGTGLGLAIVAAIVGAHGGEVAVGPTAGGGATFSIRLPLAVPEGNSETTTSPLTVSSPQPQGN